MPDSAGSSDSRAFEADLHRAAEGDLDARKRLWNDHYPTLLECAKQWFARHWQRRGDNFQVSLGGTDIMHAAFERLHDRTAALANGKQYFFRAFYTECMRIVIDHYRKTRDEKGRGRGKRVEYQSEFMADERLQTDFEVLYEVLGQLGAQDERLGQIAMLKVLETRPANDGSARVRGLTNAEIAELLGLGLRTVEKDWSFAKAFLLKHLVDRAGE